MEATNSCNKLYSGFSTDYFFKASQEVFTVFQEAYLLCGFITAVTRNKKRVYGKL
jgi:hypothetical protein